MNEPKSAKMSDSESNEVSLAFQGVVVAEFWVILTDATLAAVAAQAMVCRRVLQSRLLHLQLRTAL